MNKKITITVPDYLIEMLDETIGKGGKSKFISEAILEKLMSKKIIKKDNPVDDAFELRKNTKSL